MSYFMEICFGNVVKIKSLENIKINEQRDRTVWQGQKLKTEMFQVEEPTNMKIHIWPKNGEKKNKKNQNLWEYSVIGSQHQD